MAAEFNPLDPSTWTHQVENFNPNHGPDGRFSSGRGGGGGMMGADKGGPIGGGGGKFSHLEEMGFEKDQIDYMESAASLISSGKAKSIEDVQDSLGYGVVDSAVLRDTFSDDFKKLSKSARSASGPVKTPLGEIEKLDSGALRVVQKRAASPVGLAGPVKSGDHRMVIRPKQKGYDQYHAAYEQEKSKSDLLSQFDEIDQIVGDLKSGKTPNMFDGQKKTKIKKPAKGTFTPPMYD